MKTFLAASVVFILTFFSCVALMIQFDHRRSNAVSQFQADWTSQLQHPDPEVRRSAVSSLSQMGAAARPAIPALSQALLNDTDVLVRRRAAHALGNIGFSDDGAFPALSQAMVNDKDKGVLREAIWAISQISKKEAKGATQRLV